MLTTHTWEVVLLMLAHLQVVGAKITSTSTSPDLNYCRPNGGQVHVAISDGNGGWYIGGGFTSIVTSFSVSIVRNRIAHILSNGELDMTWDPGANNTIYSLILSGNDLFVGGQFTNIGGQNRNYIAKLSTVGSGIADPIWNPNAGYWVTSLALSGSDLYVGGWFTSIGGLARNRIAKLSTVGNGTVDANWNPSADSWVNALLLSGTDLYVGGNFTHIGGQTRSKIAKLSTSGIGDAELTWNPNADYEVFAFAISGNEIFVGGSFGLIGGKNRNYIAKLSTMGTGAADVNWNPNAEWDVYTLAVSGSDLYVGGWFSNIGGQDRNHIAKLSIAGNGMVDLNWNPNAITGIVRTIVISGSDVFVGGTFNSIGGFTRNNLVRFDKISGIADDNWNPNVNHVVNSLILSGSDLLVGGQFTNIGGQNRNYIAKLNTLGTGTADAIWNPNSNGTVTSMALSGSDLYMGGWFTNVGGQIRNYIAKLSTLGSGIVDPVWNPNTSNVVRALALNSNELYAAGDFTSIGGQARNYLAKLSVVGTGTADAIWNPNPNNIIWTLTHSGSDLYVGGRFTSIGGQARSYLAKLSSIATGTADAIWNPNPNNDVEAIVFSGNDLFVGGYFTSIGGLARNRIAKLSTTGTGIIDTNWNPNPNPNSSIKAIAFSGSELYAGGTFTSVGGIGPRQGITVFANQCLQPGTPVLSILSSTLCSSNSQSLNIVSGNLNSANNWQWYDSSCGINPIGSGTMCIVSPSLGTTYYVRGEGGCVGNAANCSSVTVYPSSTPTLVSTLNYSVCQGSSIILQVSGANTYSWSNGANTSTTSVMPITNTIYSVTGTNYNCSSTATISVSVDNTCQYVWPGDANSDGVANNLDVLELGLHFNQTGTQRSLVSNNWQSYYSNNWVGTISNGKNLNHSDCNGDGTINNDDTLAIYNNYGLVHTFKSNQSNNSNAQIKIIADESTLSAGAWGSASIYLGDASAPISNINGVAFTINYDNNLIEPNQIYLNYENSFFDSGQNLKFRKTDFANNKLYAASTHTTNNNVSGHGLIAKLHYQLKSTITNNEVLNIGITEAYQSDASGTIISLTSGSSTVQAVASDVGLQEFNSNGVCVSPNPTSGELTVSSKIQLQKIEIINLTGQLLITEVPTLVNHKMNLEYLTNGIYFINIYQNNRVIKREKVVVTK
jgi:hypothetical protein